jgi:AbrB family looped-hinge helix DNA binding protein
MKTLLSERGQVVIPKKIREAVHVEKGDEFEIEVVGETILLKPIKRFKAQKWQDYIGIGEGIVDSYLKEKREEKEKEDVYP